MSIVKHLLRVICGAFCLIMTLTGFFLSFTEKPSGPFIVETIVFAILTFLLLREPKDKNYITDQALIKSKPPQKKVASTNEHSTEYIEFDNILQRVDGQPISDDEIPYLIQVGYERALNRDNVLINLSEQEERFFDELQKSLSEINRTITMERLSNGAISVYANSYYVGRIRLTGRKHWMQILRGLTQNKTIYGELDELIQHIPEWIRYIRLHCK